MTRSAVRATQYLLLMVTWGMSGGCTKGTGDTVAADTLGSAHPAVELQRDGLNYLTDPAAVVVSPTAVFVADVGSGTVLEFARDGQFRRTIGTRGNGMGQFIGPTALALVGDSLLLIADAALNRMSVYSTTRHAHLGAYRLPAQAFSLATQGDTVLFGMQDLLHTTSIALLTPGDSAVRQLGPIPPVLLAHPRIAESFPTSLATFGPRGYRVGFTGANVVYHLDTAGVVLDSATPLSRFRRGVPPDLDTRLDSTRVATREAAPASLLVLLGALSGNRTALLHLDFIMEKGSMEVRAYLSTIAPDGRSSCIDHLVPVATDTRPVFALTNDTLYVAQNRLGARSGAMALTLIAFRVPQC
ncbi:MAG: hypothetical protein IPP90_21610 [Gemmatimonadaceae bacterium]|nr:hypothetical protein [Gemmatimonadaceae bacterium]